MKAKGMQKTEWAIMMLPRPRSKPIQFLSMTKNINVATAVTISGTISGMEISAMDGPAPLNFASRTKTSAAEMAIAVANDVATIATMSELSAASAMPDVENTLVYQRVENPPQIMASRLSLKEYPTSTTIGA